MSLTVRAAAPFSVSAGAMRESRRALQHAWRIQSESDNRRMGALPENHARAILGASFFLRGKTELKHGGLSHCHGAGQGGRFDLSRPAVSRRLRRARPRYLKGVLFDELRRRLRS